MVTEYLYLVIFYLAAFKRHYALHLAIAPEFFKIVFICAYFMYVLWVAEIQYVYVCIANFIPSDRVKASSHRHATDTALPCRVRRAV